jgi:hypothetical protein
MQRVPMGPFSIQCVPVGPVVTHPWCLQFVIKVFAQSFLHPMCTCETLKHLTCGTQWLTCHVYLWDHSLSPSDLWDPMACVSCVLMRPSDPWDPMALVSLVPVGPFSISIRLWDPTACVSLVPFVPLGSNKSKKTSMPGSRTRDPEEGMHGLYHCARWLVVLTCLWSHYSIIFSVSMPYRLTYIGYFPFKWKQIYARYTSDGARRRRRIPGVLWWLRHPFGG